MTKEELIKFMSAGNLSGAAQKGREDVQKLVPGYSPEKPHLKGTKRPDASWFDANNWEEIVDFLKLFTASERTHDEKTLIVSAYLPRIIGVTKKSAPSGTGPWMVTKTSHGLMATGGAVVEENLTDVITIIFTDEGDDNWVLATVHPGPAEEPGDYTGLKEGDTLSKEDLEARHITRVIPE